MFFNLEHIVFQNLKYLLDYLTITEKKYFLINNFLLKFYNKFFNEFQLINHKT